MTSDTRTTVGIQCGAIVGLILIIIALILMRGCESKPQLAHNNHDSLINVLKAQDKYIGIVEIDLSKANEARVKAENELRDRKPIYITRVERIIANAPDTCKPHLIAMQAECDTLQAKSDSTIAALKVEVIKADTVIKAVKSKLETVTHFNDKLTSENKELASNNKKLERKNKAARFFNKVFVGAAVGFTAVVVYLTSVK